MATRAYPGARAGVGGWLVAGAPAPGGAGTISYGAGPAWGRGVGPTASGADELPDQTAAAAESVAESAHESVGAGGAGPLSVARPVAVEAVADAGPASSELGPRVEALLLTSARPVSGEKLAVALGLMPAPVAEAQALPGAPESAPPTSPPAPTKRRRGGKGAPVGPGPVERLAGAVEWLNGEYERTGRSFRIELVAGGYRVVTLPRFGPDIAALQGQAAATRLSRAAVETLAIIAYRQPVTRAQLEAIRGVACGEVLRSLMDRRLVTIAGRAEEVGRPLLYATTRQFLDAFGLASLKDLPTASEVALAGGEPGSVPGAPAGVQG